LCLSLTRSKVCTYRACKRGRWQGPPGTCRLNIGARAYSRIDSYQFLGSFDTRQTLSAEYTFN